MEKIGWVEWRGVDWAAMASRTVMDMDWARGIERRVEVHVKAKAGSAHLLISHAAVESPFPHMPYKGVYFNLFLSS